MNNQPPRRFLIPVLLTVGGIFMVMLLLQQRSTLDQLMKQNDELRKNRAQTRAAVTDPEPARAPFYPTDLPPPSPPPAVPADSQPADPIQPPPAAVPVAVPVLMAEEDEETPPPVSTGVKTTGEILKATFRVTPKRTDPQEPLMLIVRIPKKSDARILELTPANSAGLSNVASRVGADGKSVVIQGMPGNATDVEFGLSVSGPATADIKGTCGVTPFLLDITPMGTTVR